MEMTKAQLENERKIQQLQMQAINALWKKVSSMQNASSTNAGSIDCQNIDNSSTTLSSGETVSQQIQNTLSLDNSSTTVVNDLAKTCTMLTNQVNESRKKKKKKYMLNLLTEQLWKRVYFIGSTTTRIYA